MTVLWYNGQKAAKGRRDGKGTMRVFEQTAPLVSAFQRNMKFQRWDAGLQNLEYIQRLLDDHEKAQANVNGETG